jgi:hypothetical protein
MTTEISSHLLEHLGIIEECTGCDKQEGIADCRMYSGRAHLQHSKLGGCAGRSHNREVKKENTFKVNPLKASKRGQKQGK